MTISRFGKAIFHIEGTYCKCGRTQSFSRLKRNFDGFAPGEVRIHHVPGLAVDTSEPEKVLQGQPGQNGGVENVLPVQGEQAPSVRLVVHV